MYERAVQHYLDTGTSGGLLLLLGQDDGGDFLAVVLEKPESLVMRASEILVRQAAKLPVPVDVSAGAKARSDPSLFGHRARVSLPDQNGSSDRFINVAMSNVSVVLEKPESLIMRASEILVGHRARVSLPDHDGSSD